MQTHETYIHAVAAIAIAELSDDDRGKLRPFKLTYGAGNRMVRGVTIFGVWANGDPEPEEMIEISASAQSSLCQLAGTTIHEIAHVLAGLDAGHGAGWKAACSKLGLRRVHAAGTHYQPANFSPRVRLAIAAFEAPADGTPNFPGGANGSGTVATFIATAKPAHWAPRPCSSTHGCKGGKSRGKGSGSRMMKAVCGDCGWTCRVTRKHAEAGMPTCHCGGSIELEQ